MANGAWKRRAANMARAVRDYRSSTKVAIDSVVDPTIAWTAMNAASLYGGDKALEWVNAHADDHRGLAMMGAYAALAGGLVAANKYLIVPASKAIRSWHQRRQARGEEATALGWAKTVALAGTLAVGLNHAEFKESMRNYQADGQRIVKAFERTEEIAPDTTAPEPADTMPEYPTQRNGKQDTGALEGHKLNDLYAAYTGISGVAPGTVSVDFERQLESMWDRKADFMRRRGMSNPVVQQMRNTRVEEYGRNPGRMTLDQYLKRTEGAMDDVKGNIDWDRVGKLKKLDKNELALVRKISESLNENDILAYGMTELMPTANGHLNKAVMDFMLRNGGRKYLELVPAMYDGKTSFGPYQFTEYALFDTPSEKRGASVVNLALPESVRIPGSMVALEGDDHAKAAYLFAISNIADGIGGVNGKRGLSRAQFDTLAGKWADNKDDIVQYIATAHHAPALARRSFKRWLDNKARKDYSVSCEGRIIPYAHKTQGNLAALYRHN